jgi:hypothetical protein
LVSVKAELTACNGYLTFDIGEEIKSVYKPLLSSHIEIINNEAISICQDTTALCYGGENQNWVDRYAFISFNVPSVATKLTENESVLET